MQEAGGSCFVFWGGVVVVAMVALGGRFDRVCATEWIDGGEVINVPSALSGFTDYGGGDVQRT